MAPARRLAQVLRLVACCAMAWSAWGHSQAGVLRYCDAPAELTAAQLDSLLRFGAVIKAELDHSGRALAIIARSGLDLSAFGLRYSHAGVSLQASPNTRWSVRQLYYDCDARQPRLFDQGIAGFLLGAGDASPGYVSVVLLPEAAAGALEQRVRDSRTALRLLGTAYSANAHAFAPNYQNCNQWVAEMLAVAWGGLGDDGTLRNQAQQWLRGQGYQPTRFELGNPLLMWLGGALPWLHSDDHPPQDIELQQFRVSMPASIEAFVQASVPGATRIEFCHDDRRIVIRHGWEPIADGCRPEEGDTVISLQQAFDHPQR